MWVRLFTKVLRKRRGEGRCVRMLDGINVLMHLVDVLAAIKSQRQLEVVPNMRTILKIYKCPVSTWMKMYF